MEGPSRVNNEALAEADAASTTDPIESFRQGVHRKTQLAVYPSWNGLESFGKFRALGENSFFDRDQSEKESKENRPKTSGNQPCLRLV